MSNNNLGLYIHIPFCQRKCNYCDFYSKPASDLQKSDYANALIAQMKVFAPRVRTRRFDTVFIGGGTPTALSAELLARIITEAHSCFEIDTDAEFTVETNPGLYDRTDFKQLARLGVNRLSIGLQSANPQELEMLGRIHSLADYEKTLETAREAGIANINTDIMFSLPDQSADRLMCTLDYVLSHNPTHISAYSLKLEPGTPMYAARRNLRLPDEDTDADMYLAMADKLEKAGFVHYEISNFALPGHECRHNLKYWHGEEYLGLGPAAHSYLDSVRFALARDLDGYILAYTSARSTADELICEKSKIDAREAAYEKVMLGLRLAEGVEADALRDAGCSDIEGKLKVLRKRGLLIPSGQRIALTAEGMYISNAIISMLFE